MAESTAENADTLSKELKKILTEIFHGGGDSSEADGVSGIVKSIDDAIVRIMTEFDSKKKKPPESQIFSVPPSPPPPPSAPVVFPEEFKCALSYTIMNEPVIIASGLTYEKRYIMQWLLTSHTCPKTKHVLSNLLITPNFLVYDLISQWCQDNNFVRPKISYETDIGLFSDGIDSLLNRLNSPESVEDQTEASREIRLQTKKFASVRGLFVAELSNSITRLISPLYSFKEEVDSNPELQKNIIKTLFSLSLFDKNKTAIAETPFLVSILTESLKLGTDKTRRYSAATLLSLSLVSSNRRIIGNSKTIKALIGLMEEGDFVASLESSIAVYNLCTVSHNRETALSEGFIRVLTKKIKEADDEFLIDILAWMCVYDGVIEEIVNLGFVSDLFSILRKPSSSVTCCERVLKIVLSMARNEDVVNMVGEEENKHGTFTKLAKQGGSDGVVGNADAILQWVKSVETGEKVEEQKLP
ncbi:unnamed protein product [Cochlearia groenlandica]